MQATAIGLFETLRFSCGALLTWFSELSPEHRKMAVAKQASKRSANHGEATFKS